MGYGDCRETRVVQGYICGDASRFTKKNKICWCHPRGEIVFFRVSDPTDLASVVYYYDPKRNSRRRVEIQTTLTSSERTMLRRFVIECGLSRTMLRILCD